jgi:hypothetical protein
MENRGELPRNVATTFHEDVHHEVEPIIQGMTVNRVENMVGILYRPDIVDPDMPMDDDGTPTWGAIVPYIYIEVPIVGNDTVSPVAIAEAANILPDKVTMREVQDFMNAKRDDDNYIYVQPSSHIPDIIMGILSAIFD